MITAAILAGAVAAPAVVWAGPNDLVMSRLSSEAGSGANLRVVPDSLSFRALSSELGVVLAPRLSAPADTLGFSGFQFAADMSFTTISSDAHYWRALESSPDPGGARGEAHGSSVMRTLGLFVRKGMWMPAPSFEVGAGAVHLAGSRLWSAQAYGKLALHEGFHDTPLPSFALRGGVSRMMGSQDFGLTIVSLDGSVSKAFGIQGSVHLEPFAGWNTLIIVPRSEVVDRAPHLAGDRRQLFVFRDQADILRNRVFTGVKVQHYVFALVLEASFALAGGSVDEPPGTTASCADVGTTTTACISPDQAGAQQTYTLTLAIDF